MTAAIHTKLSHRTTSSITCALTDKATAIEEAYHIVEEILDKNPFGALRPGFDASHVWLAYEIDLLVDRAGKLAIDHE